MAYEQVWSVLAFAALAVAGVLLVAREHLRQKKRVEVRAMIHRERMAAIEKGLSPMEIDAAAGDELTGGVPPGAARAGGAVDPRWVARIALGFGLVLLMGGIGYAAGLGLVPETPQTLGMRELAPLGAIPAMTGIGLILFWWMLERGASRG